MKKATLIIIIAGLWGLLLMPALCQAAIIEIGLIGQVDYVDDPCNLLENGVQVGASISGFYIYDSATPDSDIQSHFGKYVYSTAPFGISLTVNSLTFQTDPTNVDFTIGIANGIESGGGGDSYTVGSGNNLFFNNDVYIESIGWRLVDYSYTAISSTELPDVPLDLSAWQSGNYFSIHGGRGGAPPYFDETFNISGHIDSVWLIPEPATLLLVGLGGLLLRKRH